MFGLFKKKQSKPKETLNLRPLHLEMAPERPFYAIGDIHGCFAQMQTALEKIDADCAEQGIANPAVVFLGDYVDRGERSREVLDFLMTLSQNEPDAVVCLKGNHEKMMLDFIDNPARAGSRWLRYGGLQTLASFGIGGLSESSGAERLTEACEELLDAMPEGMEKWLRDLPLHWSSGNMHCVHAAMDPELPVNLQGEATLLWGHPAFERMNRSDGNWVIHGHTVVDQPRIENGRISLDTGCYYTGTLTAARIAGTRCHVL